MDGAPGPGRVWGDDDAELRAWLVEQGVDPDAVDGELAGWLEGRASDRVLTQGADLSARALASRTGVPVDVVVMMYHYVGVPVADLDAPLFTTADAVLVERMSRAKGLGDRGPDLFRVVASSMERIAEAAVAFYVQGPGEELRRRAAPTWERVRTNALATQLALDLGTGLGPIFRHHMRQTVARQRVIQEGVAYRELARLAIGFVDLVGSTALQAGLDPAALGAQVSRFESVAFDVTSAGGGRLVKFIGDEIMVAAVDPEAGVGIVADLVDTFTGDGTQPRAGLVFGEVLFRHGDYYGPVVNLAARLADAAIPGEALVDASVVDAVKDRSLRFEPAGRRMLKGFDHPVAVWSLAAGG